MLHKLRCKLVNAIYGMKEYKTNLNSLIDLVRVGATFPIEKW